MQCQGECGTGQSRAEWDSNEKGKKPKMNNVKAEQYLVGGE
jgi:hypothetical protein